MQHSVAPAPSASPFAAQGQTCLFGADQPVDCGNGNVVTIDQPSASPSPVSEMIGFDGTITGAFATASPSAPASASPTPTSSPPAYSAWWNNQPNQLQLTIDGSGYTGALGALSLAAGTAPAWTIAGGAQASTLTGTITLGFGGYGGGDPGCGAGAMSSINLTLNDLTDGLTVTLASSGGRHLTGNVTNASGSTVATISLDLSGSGTIAYTSGAVDQVKDWVVVT